MITEAAGKSLSFLERFVNNAGKICYGKNDIDF